MTAAVVQVGLSVEARWGQPSPLPVQPPGLYEITITEIPEADRAGGPSQWANISGAVSGVGLSNYRVVIYSFTNAWYIQPMDVNENWLTPIDPKSGTWQARIHPGGTYPTLLVKPSFAPKENPVAVLPVGDPNVVTYVQVRGR